MVLLESLVPDGDFKLSRFAESWQNLFSSYDGYLDHATKSTLSNFKKGLAPDKSGSKSTDLGGMSRIAPLAYIYADQPDELIASSVAQTAMTHNHEWVTLCAEFFAKVIYHTISGIKPTKAISNILEKYYMDTPLKKWVEDASGSLREETTSVISRFGQSCGADSAFPCIIHLVAKYEENLGQALIENVMAGGDSAARGMVTGMILGAANGMDALPDEWISGLSRGAEIEKALSKLK